MLDTRIGKTRIILSARAKWGGFAPDSAQHWHRGGVALGVIRYGFWGVSRTFVLRIPLTPKTYAEEAAS